MPLSEALLDEGVLKDLFPGAYKLFSHLTHKQEYMLAIKEWIAWVDKTAKTTLHHLDKIASIFRGVDRSKLAEIINNLVDNKKLESKYKVA